MMEDNAAPTVEIRGGGSSSSKVKEMETYNVERDSLSRISLGSTTAVTNGNHSKADEGDRRASATVNPPHLADQEQPVENYQWLHADSGCNMIANTKVFYSQKVPTETIMGEFKTFLSARHPTENADEPWVLKWIDYWNNDHEMVLTVTEKRVLAMKYDFVTCKIKNEIIDVSFNDILSIECGPIKYPKWSLMARRSQEPAYRIVWGDLDKIGFLQRWNPRSDVIPMCIICDHPILTAVNINRDQQSVKLSARNFYDTLNQRLEAQNCSVILREQPLVMHNYVNLSSLVFNQSQLGFSKDRNGVSF